MERELFGGESSVEEEDSSDETSDDELTAPPLEGQASKQEQTSSSDSGGSGAELVTGSPQVFPGSGDGGESQLLNTQDLFGASSSSSSSEDSDRLSGAGSPTPPLASPLASPMASPLAPSVGSPLGSPLAPPADSPLVPPVDSPAVPPMGSPLVTPQDSPPLENGGPDDQTHTVEGIFGDAADISSSEDEDGGDGELGDQRGEVESAQPRVEEPVEEEAPRINVEIPRCVAHLGSELYFVKLPNFLSVETRPFDPALYEDEVEEDEVLDEEGRARLKLKVENTIRWRYSQDEGGNEIRESNARIVKWSDGSMSLYLGGEIFDIHKQPLQGEYSHLFVRQGTGLQGQAVFKTKLTFRPHSTDSQTHRKMTLSIADRFSKTQKIRVLPAVGKDPESQRSEKIKREEEKLRAAIRRESQQRRVRERHTQRGLTANYLEPDRLSEDDEPDVSVAAIKSSVRSRLSQAAYDSDGGSSENEEGAEKLLRAKAEDGRPQVESEGSSARKKQKGRKLLLSSDEESD